MTAITGLPNGAEARIAPMNGHDGLHLLWLKQAYKNLLCYEAKVHGAGLTGQLPEEVVKAVKTNILKVQFLMVGKELAGISTSVDSFAARSNKKTNKIEIIPAVYAEDTCVDPKIAKAFREMTTNFVHPKGIGLGTLFTRERIRRSVRGVFGFAPFGKVSGARICEVAEDNGPMAGVMYKFGGSIGLKQDSKILELRNGLTPDMERRFGANVETLNLPADKTGKRSCPNNFLVRWTDNDGMEIVAIYTRTISTFTGEPVVRLQLTSNGNLPDSEMLKEVMASILRAGKEKISDRGWGLPIGMPVPAFGSLIPTIRIHAHKEPEIVQALAEMDAEDRKCGDRLMMAAALHTDTIPNQEKMFGQDLPEATPENGVDLLEEKNKPFFDIAPESHEIVSESISARKIDTFISRLAPDRRARGNTATYNARTSVNNPTRPLEKNQTKNNDIPSLDIAA